jgi:RNA polymerase sigma-70 factor (ECF subfamily)
MSPEEFNTVFRALLPDVSKFLARRVNSEDVEDLAADLFELAWSKRSQIQTGLELAWLYKSARYLIANHYRKQSGRTRIFATLQEPIAAPSAESIAIADIELSQAWALMTGKEQEVLALWSFEGLELPEIAKVLEVSENAANIRLSRARNSLRKILDERNQQVET